MWTSDACEGAPQMEVCQCSGPWRASVAIFLQELRFWEQGAAGIRKVTASKNCILHWWLPTQVIDLMPLHMRFDCKL